MKLIKQMKPLENLFLIDWVSISFRDDSNVTVDDVLDVLCKALKCYLSSFVHYDKGGLAGYNNSFRYLGESFLTVNYNVNNRKQGILVNLTGQGCRAFTKEDLFSFLRFGIESNGYFTRLDIAFDDVEQKLPLNLIRDLSTEIFSFNYDNLNYFLSSQVSRNSFKAYTNVFNSSFNNCPNLTIGSRYSAVMVRFYNKAVEQKMKDEYWWRLELQLRSEVAEMMAILILDGNFIDFYIDLLNKYSRFLDSTSEIVKVTDRPSHTDFIEFLNYLRGSFGSNNSLNINLGNYQPRIPPTDIGEIFQNRDGLKSQ